MSRVAPFVALGLVSAAALAAILFHRVDETRTTPVPREVARQVIRTAPQGLIEGLPPITAIFDRDMIPEDRVGTEASRLVVTPRIDGRAVWIGRSAIELRPLRLEPGTRYTARVPGKQWTFRTAGFRVTHGYVPTTGPDVAAPDAPLLVRFSHPVELSDLRAHTSFAVPFEVSREKEYYLLRPTVRLPLGETVTWTIHTGLRSGKLLLDKDWTTKIRICSPLRRTHVTSHSNARWGCWVSFKFNNPVEGKASFEVVPPVKTTLRRYWNSLDLDGGFEPGKTYRIALRGVRDRFGNTLAETRATVRIPDYQPEIDFPKRSGTLERLADPRVEIRFINIQRARLRILRAAPGNEVMLSLGRKHPLEKLRHLGNAREETLVVARTPNRDVRLGIPLSEPGLYLVEATSGKLRERSLVQVSDLALHAKTSPHDSLFWVTSLQEGTPRRAEIEAYDKVGRLIWKGRSGEDGLSRAPHLRGATAVVAKSAEDVALLDLAENRVPLWRHRVRYDYGSRPRYLAHVFTDRAIYRPGETVRIKATIRSESRSGLAPWTQSLEVAVKAPGDRVVYRTRLQPTPYGTVSISYRHRERDRQGTYFIQLDGKTHGRFSVESYRPAPFELKIHAKQTQWTRGDTFEGTIDARYFFGTPVQAKIRWSATLEEVRYSPPGLPDYAFGRDIDYRVEQIPGGEGNKVRFPIRAKTSTPYRLHLDAAVRDSSNQSVHRTWTWMVHPAGVYVGVKSDRYVVQAGSPVGLGVIGVTPQGKPRPTPVTVRAIRREWHTVAKKSAGGSITYHSEWIEHPIAEGRIETPASWTFTPPRSGEYVIRAEGAGAITERFLWASGKDVAGWSVQDGANIILRLDKKLYRPGETARVLVPSPYAEATALVTVERERMFRSWVVTVGTSSLLEIPIEPGHAPNVYVSVLLVKGRTSRAFGKRWEDLGRPVHRIGYVEVPVLDEKRKLHVRIATDRAAYGPGDEVKVELGSSAPAEITLFAVDEAVLALASHNPDPYAFFSHARKLGVRSAETRKRLLARTPYDEFGRKGDPGGDGGGGVSLRRRFLATAHFQVLECNGTARVTFRLPDGLTRYRVFAVAVGKGDRYGAAQTGIVVTRPLILTSALPRFARVGDRFQARVLATNATTSDGRVRVQFGREVKEALVPAGKTLPFGFPIEVDRLGHKHLRFYASLGAHRDGMEILLPVLPAAPRETRIVQGRGEGRFSVKVPELEGMEVTLSRTPLAELEGGMDYLLNYPHGCIEQTTSRTLPLLAVQWGEDAPARALINGDVRPYVQAGIDRILSMQRDDGFAYWPGGSKSHPFGTVYATHALVLAGKQGYDIPPKSVDRALKAVSKLLRTEAPVTVRAYGAYILRLGGRSEPSYVSALSRRTDLTRAARAFLLLSGGTPGPASQPDNDYIFGGIGEAVELLAEPARLDLARLLLANRVNGRWGNTTQNAFALLALAKVMNVPTKTVNVRSSLGNTRLGPAFHLEGIAARNFDVTSDGPVYWTVKAHGFSRETRRLDRGIGLLREIPAEVRAGETVKVRLRVIARETLRYVAIESPLPAGLEPILERVGSHVERRDDRVLIYADEIRPGIHEFTVRVRATTPGTFVLPQARAEEMYRPEVFGTTESRTVIVK